MAAFEVVALRAFADNYIWTIRDDHCAAVVDPGEAQPVIDYLERENLTLVAILNTHHHADHVGGNAEIKAATGCIITGPAAEAERIPTLDVHVRGGDVVRLGDIKATVIDVPAHTAGHIAYHFVTEHAAFVGDTLFAMGCGRLFEGTAAQMYDNMRKLEALGDDTAIYCAHEYTLSNARFAVTVEPDNADLTRRFADVVAARERGEATVPTTIALERATNPFMRAASVEELAARRAAKDAA